MKRGRRRFSKRLQLYIFWEILKMMILIFAGFQVVLGSIFSIKVVRDYGVDDMRVDHAHSSYQFFPYHHAECEGRPVYIDFVGRCHSDCWAAYGYWDIHPGGTCVFAEDLSFHFTGGGPFGDRVYGKSWAYRDGHAVFHTHDGRWFPPAYAELKEPF